MREANAYLVSLLGIDATNHLIIADINGELSNIAELDKFILFVRENFNGQEMAYKNGFQKFLILVKKYKNQLNKITPVQLEKINTFSDKLHNRICDVFDDMNWNMQTNPSIVPNECNVDANFTDAQIRIMKEIGDNKRILHLVVFDKNELLDEIQEIVSKKTIQKNNGNKTIQNNDVMKRLQND